MGCDCQLLIKENDDDDDDDTISMLYDMMSFCTKLTGKALLAFVTLL